MIKRLIAKHRSLSIHVITFWTTIGLWTAVVLSVLIFQALNS